MSRRHHGGRPHRPGGHARTRRADGGRPERTPRAAAPDADGEPAARIERPAAAEAPARLRPAPPVAAAGRAARPFRSRPSAASRSRGHPRARADRRSPTRPARASLGRGGPDGEPTPAAAGCTAPQLRRFIKSRPYVPMHELRRRFGINGQEDDVTPVDLADGRIFVGLPAREGGLLGELLRGGEVGYELSLDPRSPIVVGLYPMRPVPRS